MREVGAEEVALGGDGGQLGVGVDQGLGVVQGVDHDDAGQEAADGGHQLGRAVDEAGGEEGCAGAAAGGGSAGVARAVPGAPFGR